VCSQEAERNISSQELKDGTSRPHGSLLEPPPRTGYSFDRIAFFEEEGLFYRD